jgi:hypothetical protein
VVGFRFNLGLGWIPRGVASFAGGLRLLAVQSSAKVFAFWLYPLILKSRKLYYMYRGKVCGTRFLPTIYVLHLPPGPQRGRVPAVHGEELGFTRTPCTACPKFTVWPAVRANARGAVTG